MQTQEQIQTQTQDQFQDQFQNEAQTQLPANDVVRTMNNEELEINFTKLVKSERKITHMVLLYIQEIDRRSHHLRMGFNSLVKYLIMKHHYSEGAAVRRVSAMRMLTAVPEIKDKIIEGSLSLSQLNMVQTAVVKKQREDKILISPEDKRELLLKIENQTTAKTQSCLADTLDIDLAQKKQITYGKEESVFLNLKLTKEEFEKIKQCMQVLSHQATDYKDLFMVLVEKTLKAKTQSAFVVKAQGVKGKGVIKMSSKTKGLGECPSKPRTRFIPIALKREIFKRDQSQCQFRGVENQICGSKTHVQIHHLKAFARGGAHSIDNLSLRCRTHNLFEAEREGLIR